MVNNIYIYICIFNFFIFFCPKALGGGDGGWDGGGEGWGKKCSKASLQRCYYPHWSSDSLSPVCGIFFKGFDKVDIIMPLPEAEAGRDTGPSRRSPDCR